MGDFNIRSIHTDQERSTFYHSMLRDLEAFEYMLNNRLIEEKSDMIGAEQEICLVDAVGDPRASALPILGEVTDERFTNELALYNLEVNLSPQKLMGDCFSKVAEELKNCLAYGDQVAEHNQTKLLLTGILPTLQFRHLRFEYMTPEDRYKVLSQELLALRGKQFEIFLQGVDDFQSALDSVLFEACNTSFQLHLQIDPREFMRMHNWSQMITGPVLAACTNSPLLFGKELWAENRIALFKQSLDTRGRYNHARVKLPRVYFGNNWLHGSPAEIWKKDVTRFPVLLRGYGEKDPIELLEQGTTPKLKSIRLHNGTTYTWNRLCYGVADNSPHIRIECRYLPSGPTQIDEIANFAFWIGLMKALPEDQYEFWKKIDFRVAKSNFLRAARYGMSSMHDWFGKSYSAQDLLLNKLVPLAITGLEKMNIRSTDIAAYLGVFESRVRRGQTGSSWMIENYRALQKRYKCSVASRILVQEQLYYQQENTPVHEWQPIVKEHQVFFHNSTQDDVKRVEDLMNQEVISVRENVSLEAIEQMMAWRRFHHLPVENDEGKLSGLLSTKVLDQQTSQDSLMAKDIMIQEVVTVEPADELAHAEELMRKHEIGCLPVVEGGKLVGILTDKDLE